MRYLAIDLGDKRTGLALGDDVTRITSPLEVVQTPLARRDGEELLETLVEAANVALGPPVSGELVIGVPINADGSESPRSKLTRAFASRLAATSGRVVHLVDERRTSLDADARLARSGLTHKQKKLRRDGIAAAAILRSFFDGHGIMPSGWPDATRDAAGGTNQDARA